MKTMESSLKAEACEEEEGLRVLAAFVELNPNPVLRFSPGGGLVYFNEAARELAGALGKSHPEEVLPPDVGVIVERTLEKGDSFSVEWANGARTHLWSFFPVRRDRVVHCSVTDITERLALEGQLRHSQKLQSIGRLAAGVAHDFNNMLTVIQGHTGLLRADASLSPEMAESVQQVSRAAERASRLTNQLLAFSRKSVIQPRRLEVNDVLTNISTMLYRTLGEDITFQFSYAPQLPPVTVDLGMLEQVIMNLAVNARDAMPNGGQLTISTKLAEINGSHVRRVPEARPGRFVCLSLSDTGCGMEQTTMERLFEPFFTTKESGKGTGLGLAMVYGIVKQHRGWIEVWSQIGQGTTFSIYLPPSDTAEVGQPERREEVGVSPGTETVLVVEDEVPVRMTARNILERYGYRVLEAGNGVEALAVWHRHSEEIALLLTDLVMPVGLSGHELAERFIASKPDLKVVYISGYSVDVAGRELDLADAHFLEKPFDARRLARAVRDCLDR